MTNKRLNNFPEDTYLEEDDFELDIDYEDDDDYTIPYESAMEP